MECRESRKSERKRNYHLHTFEDNKIESEHRDREFYKIRENCFLVRFLSPFGDDVFPNSSIYDNQTNRSFMLRVYMPEKPTNTVAIIFNGLDETLTRFDSPDELFNFYDDLGTKMAKAGILSVLLPTPYHMNRVLSHFPENKITIENEKEYIKEKNKTIPTTALMKNPQEIYQNQLQGFLELIALVRFLKHNTNIYANIVPPTKTPIDGDAKSIIIDRLKKRKKLSISLVGYSLGGLRAMTSFLLDRHLGQEKKQEPLFEACVCINSGGGLQSLPNPHWVDRQSWKEMIDKLLQQRLRLRKRDTVIRYKAKESFQNILQLFSAFFDDVFLGAGNSLNLMDNQAAQWMLFVIGGGDELVPLRSLSRFAPNGGLNIFQVAGMGHILSFDEEWRRWKETVLNVIVNFVGQTLTRDDSLDVRSARVLARFVSLLDWHYQILPYYANIKNDKSCIDNALTKFKQKSESINIAENVLGKKEINSISAIFNTTTAEIQEKFYHFCVSNINKLSIRIKLGQAEKTLYRYERQELLIGCIGIDEAFKYFKEPLKELSKKAAADNTKIGNLMIKYKFADRDTIKKAIIIQKEKFNFIRQLMLIGFKSFLENET